jgi:DNA-binding NtrC family response regulator
MLLFGTQHPATSSNYLAVYCIERIHVRLLWFLAPGGTLMKRRILLVDDELAILLTLRAILEMNGFEVETAASAHEALPKLAAGDFHMVITDMRMEHETAGYDVIRAAKQQSYNPAVAILTAYPSLGSDWKSRGAESMLVKPMNANDLLRQIEALLIQHEDSKQSKNQVPVRAASAGKNSSSRAKRVG